jgi:hypothetical protein
MNYQTYKLYKTILTSKIIIREISKLILNNLNLNYLHIGTTKVIKWYNKYYKHYYNYT